MPSGKVTPREGCAGLILSGVQYGSVGVVVDTDPGDSGVLEAGQPTLLQVEFLQESRGTIKRRCADASIATMRHTDEIATSPRRHSVSLWYPNFSGKICFPYLRIHLRNTNVVLLDQHTVPCKQHAF